MSFQQGNPHTPHLADFSEASLSNAPSKPDCAFSKAVQSPEFHADALYLEGPLGSGKTSAISERALQLLNEVPSANILILCANHPRQQRLIKALYNRLEHPIGQMPVYTYLGYVRNTLFDWWPLVEAKILETLPDTTAKLRPELSGLEDSELLLTLSLQALKQELPEAYCDFPGTERTLVKQLVRRLRLRSENCLSRAQMGGRSQAMMELHWEQSAEMEKRFDRNSYSLRILDSNKQIDVFNRLLSDEKDPACLAFQAHLKNKIRYLFVDDVDESTPAQQAFIRFLVPHVKQLYMAADPKGGTRRGYLNAFPYAWPQLKALRAGALLDPSANLSANQEQNDLAEAAEVLLDNWKNTDRFSPLPSKSIQRFDGYSTRLEMLDGVIEKITTGFSTGLLAGDFCIVLPEADVIGISHLKQELERRGISTQLVSGTERPSDNPLVRAFLYLIQLANRKRWWVPLSMWEMKTVLTQFLQLPIFSRDVLDDLVRACIEHQGNFSEEKPLIPALSELPITLDPNYEALYQRLFDWLCQAQEQGFEDQLYSAFSQLISPIASSKTPLGDLKRVLESYPRQRDLYQGYLVQNQAFKQNTAQLTLLAHQINAEHTQTTFAPDFDRLWLLQAKSGVVADTPESPKEPDPNALVIGTPQSVLNLQIRRPVHCWLDIASRQWCRSDNAPLYHAWVHSPLCSDALDSSQPDSTTQPDISRGISHWLCDQTTQAMLFEKAGHLSRTLMLLSQQKLWCFSSDLDDEGRLQEGPLAERLVLMRDEEAGQASGVQNKIQLRDDQAPVLNYQSGKLAISAVPGAGKTFTNVALILHLIDTVKIEPEQILVLTYMDSAAQTLSSRVKKQLLARGIQGRQPAISTIHSLALRILSDFDHARRVGLSPNGLSILDEFQQEEILQKIQLQLQCKAYGRAIKSAKLSGITPEDIQRYLAVKPEHARLLEFLPAYTLYLQHTREAALLDFDDLILKAIELLESQEDVRTYYRQKYKVVIEDEAQDSSQTLQKLIHLITGDSGNIIRTGDTNQSITTTFSSADPSVFRNFINQADLKVDMTYSGRCAKEVIEFSNDWMRYCLQTPALKDAFQWMQMRPLPEISARPNPSLLFSMVAQGFETSTMETDWIVESVGRLRKQHPEKSIAILTRRNDQVNLLCQKLQQAGIEAVSLSNPLNASPVFSVLLNWLRLLACPLSLDHMDRTATLEYQRRLYDSYIGARLMDHDPNKLAFLESNLLLFQSSSFQKDGSQRHPNYDTLSDANLIQLYYDGIEFSTLAIKGQVSQLLIKITNRLFSTVESKSNGYLCALLAEQALNRVKELESASPIEVVIQHFEALQKSRNSKKSFNELLEKEAGEIVQVMTLHKAKGQEFDIVLMPYLQQQCFRSEPEQVRFDESDRDLQALEEVAAFSRSNHTQNPQTAIKAYESKLKQSVIEEEARLAYVGFTRAKKALIISSHFLNDALGFGKRKAEKTQPSLVFHWAYDWIDKRFYKQAKAPDETVLGTTL
ncbi:MAG: UvrD-helicase domain-containing protein [Vampirovibrionales bacterium]|nr:UvrD-helicase domain-containing protein [Vampirovibrionales bacterium]